MSPDVVEVELEEGEKQQYRASRILIATGTDPYRPDDIPFGDERIIDCDDILKIKQVPKSITIIGAGVIGVEYATIFSALDVKVTLERFRPYLHQIASQLRVFVIPLVIDTQGGFYNGYFTGFTYSFGSKSDQRNVMSSRGSPF